VSLNFTTVSIHSHSNVRLKWPRVKGQIIARFHTVSRAARLAKCHPNSFRLAAEGACPRVQGWLRQNNIQLET
jgi:hypothetical protein